MRNKLIVLLLIVMFFSCLVAADDDVEKIMKKLKGQDAQIEPPDPRTVQQIFEGLGQSDKSRVLTKVVDESLTKKLWDEIRTPNNRKDLIKAGLVDQKSRELLDVWDKIREERDFILKKMDESSESDTQAKSGFDKFTEDYLKRNNPGSTVDFEWKDLNRYTLSYHEKSDKPEHAKVNYDDGTILSVPFSDLPDGLKKILVEATKITYSNNYGGKFVVNVTDIMPTTGGEEKKWVVIGFKDLASNPYDVTLFFGTDGSGTIETVKGGFILKDGASVEIDNTHDILYNAHDLEQDKKGFIVIHDKGLYIFRGNIITVFGNAANKLNFTEIAIDKTGVFTDFSISGGNVLGFDKKVLKIRDDNIYSGKILTGNFELVLGRKFTINSDSGIDYEFELLSGKTHSGHLVKNNSLVLQLGFLNGQRMMPGASDVLNPLTYIGTSLVDLTPKRGSSNMGRKFIEFFNDAIWLIDRYFNVSPNRHVVNSRGYFG